MVKRDIEKQIFEKYPEVIEEAITAAPKTAAGWGAHKSEGGLYWATYKATVRRDGLYSGASGPRDFNAELIEPITRKLATGWERTFQTRLPKTFELYVRDSNTILRRFHDTVEERARQNGVGLANLAMLKTQIYTYEQLFSDLYNVLIASMTELQRDANRDFTPVVVSAMHAAYDICTSESGTSPTVRFCFNRCLTIISLGVGSFKRMKDHMLNHVDRARHTMFKDAVETVQNHLNQMCKDLQKVMEDKAGEIFVAMRQDYLNVLGGVKVDQTQVMSREERAVRAEIKPILMSVNGSFRAVIEGTVDTEDHADAEDGTPEQMDIDGRSASSTPREKQPDVSTNEHETPTASMHDESHDETGPSLDINAEESQYEL